MPKQKITREMVVEAAFELAREGGMEKVLVKNIAERLGCSVQPIYSYCSNMEGLRRDVIMRISSFFQEYINEKVDKNDYFASIGKLYLRLSKEEPNLFQMYFLSERSELKVTSLEELHNTERNVKVTEYIAKKYELSLEAAKRLHLNMVIYNQGITAMNIASGLKIPLEELENQLDMAFEAFLQQAKVTDIRQ